MKQHCQEYSSTSGRHLPNRGRRVRDYQEGGDNYRTERALHGGHDDSANDEDHSTDQDPIGRSCVHRSNAWHAKEGNQNYDIAPERSTIDKTASAGGGGHGGLGGGGLGGGGLGGGGLGGGGLGGGGASVAAV